jgi:hypothetical protein
MAQGLQEAKKGTNSYLASIAASKDLDKQITDHEKEIGELKARGDATTDCI